MSALQWALLAAGLAIVGLVYWYSRRDLGGDTDHEPDSSQGQMGLWDQFDHEFDEFGVGKPRPRSAPTLDDPDGTESESEDAGSDKLVVFYVVEKDNTFIPGTRIHRALAKQRLQFGHRHIYHRIKEVRGVPDAVFSVASIAKPGYLDPEEAQTFSTPGLVIFMNLPGPEHPEIAFDDLVRTSRALAGELNADVLDDARELLSDERVDALRAEVRALTARR